MASQMSLLSVTLSHAQVMNNLQSNIFLIKIFKCDHLGVLGILLTSFYSICAIVDCEWDEWTNGTCSKSCGGGLMTRTRKPKRDAAHGGKNCTGDPRIHESCNVQECPGKFNVNVPHINICSE